MIPQLGETPLIDRPEFDDLLAQGRFGRWSEQAANLSRQGYCILELTDADFLSTCEQVIADQQQRLAPQLIEWEQGNAGPPRVQDGWLEQEAVRRLALQPEVLDLLRQAYGREPFAFQSLNFAVGSEQPYHSDAVHFHSLPHGFMCGVWIALEDVQPDSGPLIYYPGSHRLAYHSATSLGLDPALVEAEPHPQRFFEPFWQGDVAQHGFKAEEFLPRRGQILIWHANLLHGGSPVSNKQARRWSQVVHFYFEDCLYTTPLKSFPPEQGGPFLRNPFNLAKGQRLWSDSQWQSIQTSPSQLFAPAEKQQLPAQRFKRLLSLGRSRFRQQRPPSTKPKYLLQGTIDLITPSQVIGWVTHTALPLSEVRLFLGSQLLATAPIALPRPDVAKDLDRSGPFGFELEIPDAQLELEPGQSVRLLAMTADGSFSFPLFLPDDLGTQTEKRFRAALAPEQRGRRGHFDGISEDGTLLHGWCYSSVNGPASIWLHAQDLPPRQLACSQLRAGMVDQDHPEACGFVLPLSLWPELSGRLVWASFDLAGELQLPPLSPVLIPEAAPAATREPLDTDALVWQELQRFGEANDHLEQLNLPRNR